MTDTRVPPRAAPALALRDHWYIVAPRPAIGPEARVLTCAGEAAAYRVEAGAVACDRPELAIAEQDGYVWLWHGDAPAPPFPPAIPSLRVPGIAWERGSVAVDTPWADFVENTLDLVHPMFAHPWTHPTWWLHTLGVRPVFEAEVRMTATGFTAEAFLDLPLRGRWRFMWQEFRLPDMVRLVMTPPAAHPPDAGVAAGTMEVIAHHPPETAGRTRMEYVMGRKPFPWERPGFVEVPGGRWLHAQDKRVLEGLAANRACFPAGREANVPADAYTLLFRKVVAEAAAGRWGDSWRAFPSPLTLRARI
jgi:hypothetical protein